MTSQHDSKSLSSVIDGVEIIHSFPAILRPQSKAVFRSTGFLADWVESHKETLQNLLNTTGAVKFVDFEIESPADVEAVASRFMALSDQYVGGLTPRSAVEGTRYIFTSTEIPPMLPIPQHIEMSYLPDSPDALVFGCMQPPAYFGGETPLCDFRKVYEELNPKIRDEFEQKGVRFVREYAKHPKWYHLFNPSMLKGWADAYGTTKRAVVDKRCKDVGQVAKWSKNEHLQVCNAQCPVRVDPETKAKVWASQVDIFHSTVGPDELWRIAWREKSLIRFIIAVISIFVYFYHVLLAHVFRFPVGMSSTFGNGERIPYSYVKHVRDVTWKHTVFPRWEKGDLMIINNRLVGHGRQPFRGERRVVVAWSKTLQPRPKLFPC